MRARQLMTPALPSKAMSRSVDRCLFCWICYQKLFFSGIHSSHPLGVSNKLRVSGGTLSAPAGCSPRDCGRLLAVDHSLRECTSHFFFGVDWSTLSSSGLVGAR